MALELGDLSVEELAKTIPCNEKIALENKLRYQDSCNQLHEQPINHLILG